ncbi:hypothetical protein GDO81_021170 [Engystomops pustulosus]|uniref:Uncharacterized protein n=1 Tax=Engystomops pustulosus TaxID=76066 RepID=A0AAV6ZPS8_ENGPU|nr:hypothetical protein GDO81_021170 [Engystomops pustulosus]
MIASNPTGINSSQQALDYVMLVILSIEAPKVVHLESFTLEETSLLPIPPRAITSTKSSSLRSPCYVTVMMMNEYLEEPHPRTIDVPSSYSA